MPGIARIERAELQKSAVHNDVFSGLKEVVIEVCL